MSCVHLKVRSLEDRICLIGKFKGRPSEDDCGVCEYYSGPSRGLGDKVHKVLKATGIEKVVKSVKKDCGCGKKRAALNDKFPSKDQTDA